jgi:hypothetical protein
MDRIDHGLHPTTRKASKGKRRGADNCNCFDRINRIYRITTHAAVAFGFAEEQHPHEYLRESPDTNTGNSGTRNRNCNCFDGMDQPTRKATAWEEVGAGYPRDDPPRPTGTPPRRGTRVSADMARSARRQKSDGFVPFLSPPTPFYPAWPSKLEERSRLLFPMTLRVARATSTYINLPTC